MIIVGNDDNKPSERQPLQSGSSQQQQPQQEQEQLPPPPYQPRQRNQPGDPYPYQPSQPQVLAGSAEASVFRQSPAKRFWKAFFVALLVWVLFAVLINSIVGSAHSKRWRESPRIDRGNTGYPLSKDGKVRQCFGKNGTNWEGYYNSGWNSDYQWGAETSFEVSIDSEALYLFTRGSRQHGEVHIINEDNHSDSVRVLVRASYHRQETIDGTHACLLEPASGEKSVGIFTPEWSRPRDKDDIKFDITIAIPTRRYGSARRVRKLDVNAPMYTLSSGILEEKVFFDIISLSTENSLVDVKSVSCATGKFESQNGKIQGTFSSLNSLSLHTSNSPIEANVRLANRQSDQRTSILDMSTSNGHINAEVDLQTPDHSGSPLRYMVTAKTDNDPLSVRLTDLPMGAHLTLLARTLNADAQVDLPPTYEGTFDVRTSAHNAVHLVEGNMTDPAGAGRTRAVHYDTYDNAHLSGTVAWSPENERVGRVEVSTLNAQATLRHGAGY